MPPVACSVAEYGTPTVPPGSVVVVIVGDGGGATVIDSSCRSLWVALSVTSAVNPDAPALVGVPVIAPVAAFSVSPAGSEPVSSDQVYGGVPPVAVSVCE